MDQVCQDKIGRLGGVAGSVVLYVIALVKIAILPPISLAIAYINVTFFLS
jgi:hypothetical protein